MTPERRALEEAEAQRYARLLRNPGAGVVWARVNGEIIDSSTGREPLEYQQGQGMLVPGVEAVHVPPSSAYIVPCAWPIALAAFRLVEQLGHVESEAGADHAGQQHQPANPLINRIGHPDAGQAKQAPQPERAHTQHHHERGHAGRRGVQRIARSTQRPVQNQVEPTAPDEADEEDEEGLF